LLDVLPPWAGFFFFAGSDSPYLSAIVADDIPCFPMLRPNFDPELNAVHILRCRYVFEMRRA
jgi:hypothetical protein